jgi:thiol-disulfide isomerase/thioredoxin
MSKIKTNFFLGIILFFFIITPAFAAGDFFNAEDFQKVKISILTFNNDQQNLEKISNEVNIYFFWSRSCPHCSQEKPFLEKLEQNYDNLKIHSFEVGNNRENADLLIKIGEELNVNTRGVPFTIIGEQYFPGWHNEETTGIAIENAVKCAIENGCDDMVGGFISPAPEKIDLPLFGEIEIKNFSLPILTIIIAALDGFNPCAMWVLLFLISLLLEMKNKKRMWILGTVFIVSSAFVYFLFMSAWLNLFLFLGIIGSVRIVIGLTAVIAGGYNLKEYFFNKTSGCKVTGSKKRKKVFEKLKAITQKKEFLLAIGGMVALAFSVNLVELICSAGLPAIYTQILTLTELAQWQYYLYLMLYILIFMLDDLFIFFIAMKTLQLTGITTKYSRASHLIGGIAMLIIGILLIFKPDLLMFG